MIVPQQDLVVEASRTLVMKSSAPAASARIVESKGFALMCMASPLSQTRDTISRAGRG